MATDRLFRRGKTWYTIVREPSGLWRKVSTRCTDRKAAELVDRRLQREMADPAAAAEATASLEGLLTDYLNSRIARGRAEGSIEHVHQKSRALVTFLPERAAEVTHAECEAYIVARLKGRDGHRPVQLTTIKKEFRVLKAALTLARRNGKFARDPDAVIPELEETYKPRKRALEPWDLVCLCLFFVQSGNARRAAHVTFIMATGARWSESERARREDAGAELVFLRGTKTEGSLRFVPVLTQITAAPLAWALANAPGTDMLFDAWGNVRRDLAYACSQLGIPPVTPNDLRRSFAKWLRVGGASPADIAAAMGHTTSRMVERIYGRVEPAELRKLLEQSTGGGGKHMGEPDTQTRTQKGMVTDDE